MSVESGELKKIEPRILEATQKEFAFSIDLENVHYVFILRKKRKRVELRIYRVHDGETQSLAEKVVPLIVIDLGDLSKVSIHDVAQIVANTLKQRIDLDDQFLVAHADEIGELTKSAIERWNYESEAMHVLKLLARQTGSPKIEPLYYNMTIEPVLTALNNTPSASRQIGSLHAEPPLCGVRAPRSGWRINKESTILNSMDGVTNGTRLVVNLGGSGGDEKVNNFYDLIKYVEKVFCKEIAETLEIVLTVALSVKLPTISPDLRPLWILIIGEPGSLKSSVLKFFEYSENVLFIEQTTAAGILPAKDDVPPLLTMMNGKITIFPTLSLIAAQDPKQVRLLFAFLEAIYDGRIYRKTGLSGLIGGRVDTVIIGAITNEVYEKFSDIMIEYGSRWLVYPQNLPREKFVEIYGKLKEIDIASLRFRASKMFDMLLATFDPRAINTYAMPKELEEDLIILADLMARIRVAYHVRKVYDENGRPAGEEIEITQIDYPLRAYDQLRKFVIINTIMRGWNRFLGLPEVDVHAMRLAAKIAISSTTHRFMKVMHGIAAAIKYSIMHGGALPSLSELSKLSGIPWTSLKRYLMVLETVGVLYRGGDDGTWYIHDKFFPVLAKYLGPEEVKIE